VSITIKPSIALKKSINLKSKIYFWYSKNSIFYLISIFLCLVFFASLLTPPMQSPDEFNHLKRAYLIGEGVIFLEKQNGQPGGYLDDGLVNYMSAFANLPFHPDVKVDKEEFERVKQEKWKGSKTFITYEGTPLYSPLVYFPQAIGLKLGEKFNLTIDMSYKASRLSALIVSGLIIIYAAIIFPVPPVAFAIIFTPISLFQLGTTSPDGLVFSLSLLFLSMLSKFVFFKGPFKNAELLLFLIVAVAVMTRYFNFYPAFLAPLFIYYIRKEKIFLLLAFLFFLLPITWIFLAFQTHTMPQASIFKVILFYIESPIELFKIYYNTLTRYSTLRTILFDVIGNLGWHDTKLNGKILFVLPFFYLIFLTILKLKIKINNSYRQFLIILAISYIFLLMFMLLIGWTSHPAKRIDGLAGRYFTPILLFISYAYSNYHLKHKSRLTSLYMRVLSYLVLSSFFITSINLYLRYWKIN